MDGCRTAVQETSALNSVTEGEHFLKQEVIFLKDYDTFRYKFIAFEFVFLVISVLASPMHGFNRPHPSIGLITSALASARARARWGTAPGRRRRRQLEETAVQVEVVEVLRGSDHRMDRYITNFFYVAGSNLFALVYWSSASSF